jgi:hypothetical protein
LNWFINKDKNIGRFTHTIKKIINIQFTFLKKYIINNKNYFFARSNDLEWIKAILTIHNFRDCDLGKYYDRTQRKYIKREASTELTNAFKEAKIALRKKRKTK